MAPEYQVLAQDRPGRPLSRPFAYHRSEKKVQIRKVQRKIALRVKHILLFFILLAGMFYGLHRAYLFVISWEKLAIKNLQVLCVRPEIRQEVARRLAGMKLGNILLCDLGGLKRAIQSFSWVKEARIQKVFPSSLKIEVKARIPLAVARKGQDVLLDEEGVELGEADPAAAAGLPLLLDRARFMRGGAEKLLTAREFLESLSAEDKSRLESLDLSDFGKLVVRWRDDGTALILGGGDFSRRISFFENQKSIWESRYGILEYVDLRFDDRVILKPLEPAPQDSPSDSEKEAE
jgi:cell division septal protein FtsQ